jgi:hypothetical protein
MARSAIIHGLPGNTVPILYCTVVQSAGVGAQNYATERLRLRLASRTLPTHPRLTRRRSYLLQRIDVHFTEEMHARCMSKTRWG